MPAGWRAAVSDAAPGAMPGAMSGTMSGTMPGVMAGLMAGMSLAAGARTRKIIPEYHRKSAETSLTVSFQPTNVSTRYAGEVACSSALGASALRASSSTGASLPSFCFMRATRFLPSSILALK